MNKVWNAETNEWDYLADVDAPEPRVAPMPKEVSTELIRARKALEELSPKPQVTEQYEKQAAMSQSERNRRYRQSHADKHRQYHLDYMKEYREKQE